MRKINTLKKNYEFKRVLDNGEFFYGKYIHFFIIKNKMNINRIGIAVSSKIAGAVKRNKIKRLIRENYRLLEKEIKESYDIVIIWKKNVPAEAANFKNISEDMLQLFERASLNN